MMKLMSKNTIYGITFLILLFFTNCKKNISSNSPDFPDSSESRPNIIFIIADDMGWDAFGQYPNANGTKAKTPTLDSMARNGITFTNNWVTPECSPTRAALLTGRYGFRTGVGNAGGELGAGETIIQKYITDKTGNTYSNAVIGKWHVSNTSSLNAPQSFGVQYFSGFLTGVVPDYYDWTQTTNGIQQNISTYSTTQFVNQSVDWIRQQTKPFFLWLAFNAPHTPFHRPPLSLISDQSLVDNEAAINSNPLPYYLASIEAMDKEIGRLIASLTTIQKENTVFIIIGDNGTPPQVAQNPYSKNKVKSTLFQGGINTPLIICGKNVSRKNATENTLVQATDFFATLADITGAGNSNNQDGISMKPLFSGQNSGSRTISYSEQFGSAITTNDGYSIRNNHYKLIHLQSGTEYLYKISSDPFEQSNLLTGNLSNEAKQNADQLRLAKAGL